MRGNGYSCKLSFNTGYLCIYPIADNTRKINSDKMDVEQDRQCQNNYYIVRLTYPSEPRI